MNTIRAIRNVKHVLANASPVEISEGRVAYYRYREVCKRVADRYGYPLHKVVACFAALSPNLDYFGNVRSLLSVVDGHARNIPVNRITTSGYNHCRDRAYSYLSDVSFEDTVKGLKIRNFYHNILYPLSAEYVTIDGHAINICLAKKRLLKEASISKTGYEEAANVYKRVATFVHLLPHQVQAITWLAWRRMHGIQNPDGQLHLFVDRTNDMYRTLSIIDEVTPYETTDRKSAEHPVRASIQADEKRYIQPRIAGIR